MGRPFLLPWGDGWYKIRGMENEMDVEKAVRQHIEMDEFFSGGLRVKGTGEIVVVEMEQNMAKGRVTDAAAGLAKIAAEVGRCCQCGVGAGRKHVVPGEGNPQARLVFVGEAPGADEDEQGRPFVGRAGKLLDGMINAMGLKREDVFICNVLKCRPPDNRDPRPEEIEKCMPYLLRQIELIGPEVIVALGAHAAKTLLNSNEAIGKLRGRFHEYYTHEGVAPIKLMPTYHPAYLLRNYSDDNRRRVWEDLQKVMGELGLEGKKKKG